MTDNEIISIDEAIRHCYETYFERDDLCREFREEHKQLAKWLEELKESRNTINRQKAEIEELKEKHAEDERVLNDRVQESVNAVSKADQKYICALERSIAAKDVERERLLQKLQQAKFETIKEFAERLKKYLCLDLREGISVVTIDNIDKIVKEMIDKE